MPIRLRVTLLSTWLLAVALAVFGLVFYLVLVDSLRDEVDRRLTGRAAAIAGLVTASAGAPIDLQSGPIEELREPGVFAQVLDPRGEVITATSILQNSSLPVDPVQVQRALGGQRVLLTVPIRESVEIRMLYEPLAVRGTVVGVLQVAESLAPLEVTATRVQRYMSAAAGLTLALATVFSWVVVGRALEPIAVVTRSARQIRATGDVGRRVPAGETRDEVGLLAETINEMLAGIERTLGSQRDFLADSSHELRSPLTVIRGNLDLLRRAPDEESREECLREAEAESARMGRIVDDLLLLARQDAELTFNRQPVDVAALIGEVERRARVVSNGVALAVARADPAFVEGDAERLRQAIANLVDNALRHTAAGGSVTLSAVQSNGRVAIEVADTGIGIAAEHLPRLFDRFYRVDVSRARSAGGTGLGLAIVKYVAEAHGGGVGVVSEVGRGSRFLVWLPVMGD